MHHVIICFCHSCQYIHAKAQITHFHRIAAQDDLVLLVFVLHGLFQLHIAYGQAGFYLADLVLGQKISSRLSHTGIRGRFLEVTGQVQRVDFLVSFNFRRFYGVQRVKLAFLRVCPVRIDVRVYAVDVIFLRGVHQIQTICNNRATVYLFFQPQRALQAVKFPVTKVGVRNAAAVVGEHRSPYGYGLCDGKSFLVVISSRNLKLAVANNVFVQLLDRLFKRFRRKWLYNATAKVIRDMVRRNLKPSIHRAADAVNAEQLPVFVAGRPCADDAAL